MSSSSKPIVITVHGILNSWVNYSARWRTALNWNCIWFSFYWDDLNAPYDRIAELFTPKRFDSAADQIADIFTYRKIKAKAIQRLINTIQQFYDADNNVDIIILAHSLGTVLTYETLCKLPEPIQNRILLFTLGSPLVFKTLRWGFGTKNKNLALRNWYNITGNQDPITGFGRTLTKFSNININNNIIVSCDHLPLNYINVSKKTIDAILRQSSITV